MTVQGECYSEDEQGQRLTPPMAVFLADSVLVRKVMGDPDAQETGKHTLDLDGNGRVIDGSKVPKTVIEFRDVALRPERLAS